MPGWRGLSAKVSPERLSAKTRRGNRAIWLVFAALNLIILLGLLADHVFVAKLVLIGWLITALVALIAGLGYIAHRTRNGRLL